MRFGMLWGPAQKVKIIAGRTNASLYWKGKLHGKQLLLCFHIPSLSLSRFFVSIFLQSILPCTSRWSYLCHLLTLLPLYTYIIMLDVVNVASIIPSSRYLASVCMPNPKTMHADNVGCTRRITYYYYTTTTSIRITYYYILPVLEHKAR